MFVVFQPCRVVLVISDFVEDTSLLPWCVREPALSSREREEGDEEVLGPEVTRVNALVLKVVMVFLPLCTLDHVLGMRF